MNTPQIDSVVLSEVGEHWTKVAGVIVRLGYAMGSLICQPEIKVMR